MNETLAPLRSPKISGILADLLCDLIIDIRKILINPNLQNHVKLAAIAEAVDELAPPPPPPPPPPGEGWG
jgi:hypothetical protein